MFVLGLLIAALAPACKTKQQTSQSTTRVDSVYIKEVIEAKPIKVFTPADSAAIKAQVICPNGGEPILIYKTDTVKQIVERGHKQASVGLQLYKGTLIAKAGCDSLVQVIIAQNKLINQYRGHQFTQAKAEVKTITQQYIPRWVWWLLGLNILAALYGLIKLYIRFKQRFTALPF